MSEAALHAERPRPGVLELGAEAVMLIAIVAAPWPLGSAPDAARYSLCAVVLLAATLWGIVRLIRGDGLTTMAIVSGVLAVGLSVPALFGPAGWPSAAEAGLVLAAMLAALVFWSERARDPAAARRLVAVVLVTCSAQATFAIAQRLVTPGRLYGRPSEIVTAPFGSFVNHNHCAALLGAGAVLALGAAVGKARAAHGATPASLALGGLGLALVAVQLTSGSRGGLLALSGGIVALVLMSRWSRGRVRSAAREATVAVLGLAAMVAFAIAAVPADSRARLATVMSGSSGASGAYRLDTAHATLRMWTGHPVAGSGLGGFPDLIPAFKRGHGEVRTTHAESDVLEFTAETGLLGLGLLGGLAAIVAGGLRDRLRLSRDVPRKGLAIAAGAAAITLAVHACLDFPLRLPAVALVFVALTGMAAAPRSEPSRVGGRSLAASAALVLLMLTAAAGWRAAGAFGLDATRRQKDPARRAAALGRLLDGHPYLAEAHRERAHVQWRSVLGGGQARSAVREVRLASAERDLRKALALRPRWGEVWADLGSLRWMRGDLQGATQAFTRALELDPMHRGIRRVHEEFRARAGVGG